MQQDVKMYKNTLISVIGLPGLFNTYVFKHLRNQVTKQNTQLELTELQLIN